MLGSAPAIIDQCSESTVRNPIQPVDLVNIHPPETVVREVLFTTADSTGRCNTLEYA